MTLHTFVIAVSLAWLGAVVAGAQTGFFASLYQPYIAALVAAGIVLPTVWYFRSADARLYFDALGLRAIARFHVWRIPAALLFFWYGLHGQLPFAFWFLAGVGDLAAGCMALGLSFGRKSAQQYRAFHRFGFADFVVAVGTGLTYTLLQDPRMAPVAVLPMALIPLYGVGISGATHLISFDMLRRGADAA